MQKTNDRRIICVQRMPFPSCRAWTVVLVGVLHSHTIRAPYCISQPSQGAVIFFLKLSCLTWYNNVIFVILNFCPLFESCSYNQINLLNCYTQNKYGYNIGCPPASFLTVYCSLMLSQFYIRNSTYMIQGWGYSAALTTWKKRKKQMAMLQWILRWTFQLWKHLFCICKYFNCFIKAWTKLFFDTCWVEWKFKAIMVKDGILIVK